MPLPPVSLLERHDPHWAILASETFLAFDQQLSLDPADPLQPKEVALGKVHPKIYKKEIFMV